eukprot:g31926.t1
MKDPEEVKSQQASIFTSEASKIIFQFRVCTVEQDEPLAESIRIDVSLSGVTIPGRGDLQIKTSLYIGEVTIFCSNPLSVRRFMSICNQFEPASGAKVIRDNIEPVYFGNLADESSIPFPVRTDYLKVLGIWFSVAWTRSKSWEEQKLEFWEHLSLSIVGKNLVIRCEAFSLLLYVAHVWPIPENCAVSVTRAIFHFVWRPKIDQVCRDFMDKTLDRCGVEGFGHHNLMAAFVCGCMKLCIDPRYTSIKFHEVLRFDLFPVLKRMGLASLPQNTPSSWT